MGWGAGRTSLDPRKLEELNLGDRELRTKINECSCRSCQPYAVGETGLPEGTHEGPGLRGRGTFVGSAGRALSSETATEQNPQHDLHTNFLLTFRVSLLCLACVLRTLSLTASRS